MIPYIWNKIDWNFVFKILIGIAIGSPIGLYLLKYLSPETTHLYVCLIIIFFSILLMKGYSNKKINNNPQKFYRSNFWNFKWINNTWRNASSIIFTSYKYPASCN